MKKKKTIQDKKSGKITSILFFLFEAMLVVCLAAICAYGYCSVITMQEGSMEPTLSTQEKYLIDKMSYKFSEPKRGDIIAFRRSDKKEASIYVKRIIGVPGETIQIKDGKILINQKEFIEKKKYKAIHNPGLAEKEIKLGNNEFFVLGDNRNGSEDSRFLDVGNVLKKNIVGRLWCVVSPFNKIGLLRN